MENYTAGDWTPPWHHHHDSADVKADSKTSVSAPKQSLPEIQHSPRDTRCGVTAAVLGDSPAVPWGHNKSSSSTTGSLGTPGRPRAEGAAPAPLGRDSARQACHTSHNEQFG